MPAIGGEHSRRATSEQICLRISVCSGPCGSRLLLVLGSEQLHLFLGTSMSSAGVHSSRVVSNPSLASNCYFDAPREDKVIRNPSKLSVMKSHGCRGVNGEKIRNQDVRMQLDEDFEIFFAVSSFWFEHSYLSCRRHLTRRISAQNSKYCVRTLSQLLS
ncbi:hypothetical protein BDQ12DRAFT_91822 [Crucibulum laeve]|uniref:Uncharacterized protein n=1 Tax=Crucibulum laeve TaxID=68775 RepID=A0A5C3LF53_9AGAR|nr:hypothetical protein BDQ12DRAFT_91822 [Crucibulum laeve]